MDIFGPDREAPGAQAGGAMVARPKMERKSDRVRVEFSLSGDLAESVYRYAKTHELTLSQTGARLLAHALASEPL